MARTRYNERTWASDVASEANAILRRGGRLITRADCERTIVSTEGSLFPEVLLYQGATGASILQGWELKMPDTPVTDAEFINNAREKAKRLGLNSFLLWNVSAAVLYRSTDLQNYSPFYAWPTINHINTRETVEANRTEWVALLGTILNDLDGLFRDGHLSGRDLIGSFSDTSIIEALLENAPAVGEVVRQRCVKDAVFAAEVNQWWAAVKGEYPLQSDKLSVLARLILVNWANRFLFAHVLKSHYVAAEGVRSISEATSIRAATEIFRGISDACDFWTVFQPFLGENCLTGTLWRQFGQLNALLSKVRFEVLGQDVLRRFLEAAVALYQRKVAGQYTTPPALADILVRLVLLDRNEPIFDPCCGTGTILRAAYNLKVECGLDRQLAHESIWASDKYPFPLQVASIALSPPECMGSVLHVFKADAVSLRSGEMLQFTDPNNGSRLYEALPLFRFIATNLPFVKQEDVDVANPQINEINRFIAGVVGADARLDPRSDLYAYLPFALWRLLADEGRIGINISNAWLATDWGRTFRALLQNFYRIDKVIISGSGRWFEEPDVVTTLLILEKRTAHSVRGDRETISFVRVDKQIQACNVGSDTCAIAENALLDKSYPGLIQVRRCSQAQICEMEDLGMQWSSLFADLSWLPPLREKLVKVQTLFAIQRGQRRGWDPMFYPAGGHSIEPEYLLPVLKTPRSVDGLVAIPDALAFCCQRSLADLRALNHRGALRWINRFAHASNEKGTRLPISLRMPGMEWYQMDGSSLADLVMMINPDRRLFVARLAARSFVNQRLTRLTVAADDVDVELCHAILNSMLGVFYIEALGFGRGLGVLDVNATKLRENMYMLNPEIVAASSRSAILGAFAPLLARPVEPIMEELGKPDRKRFDEEVLAAFDIRPLYTRVRQSFLTLYDIRKAVGR